MRLARTFSTALRRCRQALYEPYIEPLNKEKKKALRKVIMGDLPDINKRLPRDIQITLGVNKPIDCSIYTASLTVHRITNLILRCEGNAKRLLTLWNH